ncbi:MBL fold metallo-hydrolase RNA specificity domain-containing protein [Sphingobacterium composti Ten et al. 2007 non Yoo et al. 2007]|uniref:MBL fold metallo-hydrolase RNA specificity domain-containing protein n=1 Tax=Sphingobacterium composti TaxID=363260 RepID=UPI0013573FFF|nr:MBL fold metallo-hydrolase RNA specificity domain-containing protein [Sphingobacterium composti Ten et al. 2007 non Yoo et al. 2007]
MLNTDILEDFLIENEFGYYCAYGDFYIDPKYPVGKAVISHAHGDHAVPGHKMIFATSSTIVFMQHRFTKQPINSYYEQSYNETFKIGEVEISFIPAGHILGSAQILMVYDGVRYLYTGDYKLQEDHTCEPIEYIKADVLITETTFADPAVNHPDPIAEIQKLNSTSLNIMLGCYALGKAQRITNLINTYCPQKTVYTHHNIAPIHRIYDDKGFVKLTYEIYNRKALKDGQDKIYLVPPMTFHNYFRAKNVVRVFASGWKRLQNHNDMMLFISDHIDWNDLNTFIAKVEPTEIWTVHGEGMHLKSHYENKIKVRNITKS